MKIRYERKYLVPNEKLIQLRNRIKPFVRPDFYADNGQEIPQYTVRSIYFDTAGFDSFYEKMEGLKDRKKLRIRGYDTYHEGCNVFLEIKRKLENRIAKNRALVPYDGIDQLLAIGDLSSVYSETEKYEKEEAGRFLFNMKRYDQKPANLIVYDREPYHGKFDQGVRITFDKNIRGSVFPAMSDLYTNAGLKYLWEKHFILEIKYFSDQMPTWARSIVQEFGLRHEALSKYAQGFIKNRFSDI